MPETHETRRDTFLVDPSGWPGGVGGSLVVGTLTPTFPTNGTLLRAVSFPSVHVEVGPPGSSTPPQNWWSEACFDWFMWADNLEISPIPSYGFDPVVVHSSRLIPTLVADPTGTMGYYVSFEGAEQGFESRSQRKVATGEDIFSHSGMRWEDPMGGLNYATYASVRVTTRTLDIAVFGINV